MQKKVRFPLDMGDGVSARTMSDLLSNFNIERVLFYFYNRQLLQWLEDRYYDYEAEQVKMLSESEDKSVISVKLSGIFGQTINVHCADEVSNEKIIQLRKYTSDDNIIKNADYVAFDQNDLKELISKGVKIIFLCGNGFNISIADRGKKYIGVNSPNVRISESGNIDLSSAGIIIQDCVLSSDDISRIIEQKAEIEDIAFSFSSEAMAAGLKPQENIEARAIYNEGLSYFEQELYDRALPLFKQAANMNYPDAQYEYAHMYHCGLGTAMDINNAEKWYRAAMDNGHIKSCDVLGDMYRSKELANHPKALECFKLGAERGSGYSLHQMGSMYVFDNSCKDVEKGLKILLSAVDKKQYDALRTLGCYYEEAGDYETAIDYYERYIPHYYAKEYVMTDIAKLYCKMNNMDKALQYFKNAAPGDSEACTELIKYYKSTGNKVQALKWYHYAEETHGMDETDLGFSEADLLLGSTFEGTAVSETVNNVVDKIKTFTSFFK